MACMPKICKQLVPAAQDDSLIVLLNYLTTMTESLLEEGSCDTCCTGKENEMYNDYCCQSAPQNDSI